MVSYLIRKNGRDKKIKLAERVGAGLVVLAELAQNEAVHYL